MITYHYFFSYLGKIEEPEAIHFLKAEMKSLQRDEPITRFRQENYRPSPESRTKP